MDCTSLHTDSIETLCGTALEGCHIVSSLTASVSGVKASRRIVTDDPNTFSILDKCQVAVQKIRVVVSDKDGRTLFDSGRNSKRLYVQVCDEHGGLIFSSKDCSGQSSQHLKAGKTAGRRKIRQNGTEKLKIMDHECVDSNSPIGNISQLTPDKKSTANTKNKLIPSSEKNNISDSERPNRTDDSKNNITNDKKNNIIIDKEHNMTNEIVGQKLYQEIKESKDFKDQNFVFENDLKTVNTFIDYKQESHFYNLSSTSAKAESGNACANVENNIRSKRSDGIQNLISKTSGKQSAISDDLLKCDICGVEYKSDIMLNRHKKVHEKECTDSSNPLQCPICMKIYQTWKSLTVHKRKHSAAKDQVCDSCGKMFRTKQELIRHEYVHTNSKSFPCHICGKLFKNKAYAQMHSRLHSVENRKHVCKLCGKNFLRGSDIHKHMRVHTGEKPFICSHCGRSFCESSHLIRHERLHTGEKPYRCDICDLSFTHKEVLLRHSYTHGKYLPFSCDVCCKGFKTKRELNHHCLTHKVTDTTILETCKVTSTVSASIV